MTTHSSERFTSKSSPSRKYSSGIASRDGSSRYRGQASSPLEKLSFHATSGEKGAVRSSGQKGGARRGTHVYVRMRVELGRSGGDRVVARRVALVVACVLSACVGTFG